MPQVGFEPTISAGERPKTYALDRAATGTGRFEASLSSPLCPKMKSIRKNVKANIMATSILFHSDCFMYELFRTVVIESVVSSALVSCPSILLHGSACADLEF